PCLDSHLAKTVAKQRSGEIVLIADRSFEARAAAFCDHIFERLSSNISEALKRWWWLSRRLCCRRSALPRHMVKDIASSAAPAANSGNVDRAETVHENTRITIVVVKSNAPLDEFVATLQDGGLYSRGCSR